jgi:hypothetical protein
MLLCNFLLLFVALTRAEPYFSISVRATIPTDVMHRIQTTESSNFIETTEVVVNYPFYQHLTILLVRTVEYRDRCLFFLRNAEIYDYSVEQSLQHDFASLPWSKDRIDQAALPLNQRYYSVGEGAGVDIYIVDSGVNYYHSELSGRVVRAWRIPGQSESPCGSHGSWVASIAAGATVGVASAATIYDVRVARDSLECAFFTSDAINALAWIASNAAVSSWGNITRPGVINLSWIGPGNSIIDSLVEILFDMGFVVVAAAGNSASAIEPCAYSPARSVKAICVGATTRTDHVATFSNYGSCVDIFAPGKDIIGAVHSLPTGFIVQDGTSASAPIVAGIAAVLYARENFDSALQVTELMRHVSAWGVIQNLDLQSPNRLANFYALVNAEQMEAFSNTAQLKSVF